MHRLYLKSEIWFAVLWIIAYVAGTSAADLLSEAAGLAKGFTLLYHLLLSAAALVWIRRHGLMKKYGLCRPAFPASRMLYYLPLCALVSCNLWFGIGLNLSVVETILYAFSMICVGFLEEVIFRGFLFRAMEKDGVRSAVIVSSITFGIGHIVNLINGSGAETLSTICQVGYAIAFGFLFVILFLRGRSLLPCILAHSVMNALSVFANEDILTGGTQIAVSVILGVGALAYTAYLLRSLPCQNEKSI